MLYTIGWIFAMCTCVCVLLALILSFSPRVDDEEPMRAEIEPFPHGVDAMHTASTTETTAAAGTPYPRVTP